MNDTDYVALAKEYGTPLLVIDLDRMRARAEEVRACAPNVVVDLPLKALGWPEIAVEVASSFDEIMVCTPHELHSLRAAGLPPDRIAWFGAARSGEVFRSADPAMRVVLDSAEEHAAFRTVWADGRIALRVSPDGEGAYTRFGMPLPTAASIAHSERQRGAGEPGFAFHADSAADGDAWLRPRLALATLLRSSGASALSFDAGGGLLAASLLTTKIADLVQPLAATVDHLRLCLGRYVCVDAGTIVTTVVGRKDAGRERWVFVDAGANVAVPLQSARFAIRTIGDSPATRSARVADAFSRYGVFAEKVLPERVAAGDLLLIERAGAYTWSMRSGAIAATGTAVAVEHSRVVSVARG